MMKINPDKALKITDRIWWVGHYLEGDQFQCHCYLIENGDESILFDPGSRLTFPQTFRKIEEIIPFSKIKYFVVHHQDPDITGALDIIDSLVIREDARIISHWRAIALLKHLDLKLPISCVEEMNWTLQAEGRKLQFIFTPYLHFPGAFCTYDPATGVLFSSDILGGFTEGFSLFAEDENYFESVKMFHEHYMPSREILAFAMNKFQQLPLKYILPQHGSIIREKLIPFFLQQLKDLDCGLYMLTQTSTEIQKLSLLNKFMNDFMQTLIFHKHFDTTAKQLLEHIRSIIPACCLKFLVKKDETGWRLLEEKNRYRGVEYKPDKTLQSMFSCDKSLLELNEKKGGNSIILPLKQMETGTVFALAMIGMRETITMDSETESILMTITNPLCIALERELIQQQIDNEKQAFYEMSIKDTLTGLYNRTYMNETLPRLFSHHDRGVIRGIGLLMLDLDHFKAVNDTFGHNVGDIVLKKVAITIHETLRDGDIAVRVGGEEFAVIFIMDEKDGSDFCTERIRKAVEEIDFSEHMGKKNQ
ncbi:MAG: diguanylate cyclase, partial [Spirochaetales bacterium]|nr:diguanylate cyclase [Spirochaetales bacterium]